MSTNDKQNKTKDVLDAATGLVKAVPIYEDLLQPTTKELGKSLEIIAKSIKVALSPFKGLIWGYEKLEEFIASDVAKKLKNIPEDRICTPNLSVAGPALEALKYTGHSEELREMYARLLATSLDSYTANDAHPAFVEVIKQLKPEEARLIKYLSERFTYPEIYEFRKFKKMSRSVEFVSEGLLSNAYLEIFKKFFELCQGVGIERNADVYLDNLKRLQLLEIMEYNEFAVEGEEINFTSETDKKDKNILNEIDHTEVLQFTSFGQQFVYVCVKEKT